MNRSLLSVTYSREFKVQIEIPIKEGLPPKDKREVSEKEIPDSKPAFDEVQVGCSVLIEIENLNFD